MYVYAQLLHTLRSHRYQCLHDKKSFQLVTVCLGFGGVSVIQLFLQNARRKLMGQNG